MEQALPFKLTGNFRPWRYDVSHSRLRIRSTPHDSGADVIDIAFHGVLGVKLRTVYTSLTLSEPNPDQERIIHDYLNLKEVHRNKISCLMLSPEVDDSFVACLGFSVWSHPQAADFDATGIGKRESKLLFRS
ncbi:hypothetical protein ACWEPN_07190 [Nonomuraea wenchangensis]